MLVAIYREMRAGRPLAGLRASAAAVRPLEHGVQTSTEHLGHVGAEGDEKYVTG